MLKLIVFDWDGTLADSVSMITKGKTFLAYKYGFKCPTDEMVRSVLGTKFEDAMAKCFPDADDIALKSLCDEYHLLMQQDEYQAVLFPDVKTMLSVLKGKGYKLAVATSKNKEEMQKALQYNGVESAFDIVCCGNEYGEKPVPTMLIYIMNALRVKNEECLMIGDTVTDLEFAKNANVKVIAVTFGAHSEEKLKPHHPLAFLSDWTQLQGVLDKLCSMKISCRL